MGFMYNKNMNKMKYTGISKKNKKLVGLGIAVLIALTKLIGDSFGIESPSVKGDEVSLVSCIDGDTANFNVSGVMQKVRFIAVDTPEIPTNDFYAKEAKDYVCGRLMEGPIYLEHDPNSDKFDKYGRMIAWVYVGDSLLQKEIVEQGYGKVKYIYGDYMHVDSLNQLQSQAKKSKLGIWR